eukprot:jgi/Psemu1/256562/estExt_Genewise1Plus.C_1850026
MESLSLRSEHEHEVGEGQVDNDYDNDEDEDEDDEEEDEQREYREWKPSDPHPTVLVWLNNRAAYAEANLYKRPWRLHRNDNLREAKVVQRYDESKYQNGFYFARRYIQLESNSTTTTTNVNVNANATEPSKKFPRLVAHRTIPKGAILLSVPSTTFLYKANYPSYKQLHPCDVVAKLLDATTYNYPTKSDPDVPFPSLEKFVRPFIDSIYELHNDNGDDDDDDNRNGTFWTDGQLELLHKILGNELEPKPNTLGALGDWFTNTNTNTNQTQPVCQYPNNNNNNQHDDEVESFVDTINNENIEERHVRSMLRTVLTRGWDNRMVPVYHWIPRASPVDPSTNLVHSEVFLTEDEKFMKTSVREKRREEREENDEVEVVSTAFQLRAIYNKLNGMQDPYDAYLVWDYYPESKTIRWVHKVWGTGGGRDHYTDTDTAETIRATQRTVLQAQYNRLRSLEPELRALLLLLEHDDPVDYNMAIASHECTHLFEQFTYEVSKTNYADLEWTRSYIGGGTTRGDNEEEYGHREQDTCLHLNQVLHSCLAFRPHVHETLIHYPASFLPKGGLKRVLYVGGGDLVLLHELLRYESVELVIGMELDQMVLRGSFRHYGIQPKFEDERVHWWFGDAAKSLSLLPPEEFFGTFDLVLIDLVVEIFDALRVGDQNERLVDYMAKLLKPEGILVRQEDYPHHNVVDFAKYTVDLNIFGMPHTCSQYFTMASNTVDFANHERVDHQLEGLVWYEPNIGSNDHLSMWGDYRNNLVPPQRICDATPKTDIDSIPVLPSKGVFVAIEAENVTLPLANASLVQTSLKTALKELGFTGVGFHSFSTSASATFSTHSVVAYFDEGYLSLRAYPDTNYCSMDLQLWNGISGHEPAVSKLVEAVGGSTADESTSSFLITTGGMFGLPNVRPPQTAIVPSSWCQDDVSSEHESSETSNLDTLMGLETVLQNMLANFIGPTFSTVLVLCPDGASRCRVRDDVDYGTARVISFDACPAMMGDNDSSLSDCEKQLSQTIQNSLSSKRDTDKIDAIVIDSQAPRELGQITKKLFVTDPTSYQWLSHDYVVLAPSAVSAKLEEFSSSWRYQLLERFRTDLVEFNPVYHATAAVRNPSSPETWTMGVLRAGNPRFYDQLVASFQGIREERDLSREIILVQTKTGAISHIPDYQPSKWATPSDYDIQPAEQQWSDQRPVGGQVLIQYQRIPSWDLEVINKLQIGARVLFYRSDHKNWCVGTIVNTEEDNYIIQEGNGNYGYEYNLKRRGVILYDTEAMLASNDTIPFGSMVLADGDENLEDAQFFYDAQIIGLLDDGRYKVYYLDDGTSAILDRTKVVVKPTPSFSSPAEAKLFSSCTEFHDFLFGDGEKQTEYSVFPKKLDSNRNIFEREVGDGCLVAVSWDLGNGTQPTTAIVTYDGQIHIEFNAFQPNGDGGGSENFLESVSTLIIPQMKVIQNDSHPRGYGRVVNFKKDLENPHFGTKYPKPMDE